MELPRASWARLRVPTCATTGTQPLSLSLFEPLSLSLYTHTLSLLLYHSLFLSTALASRIWLFASSTTPGFEKRRMPDLLGCRPFGAAALGSCCSGNVAGGPCRVDADCLGLATCGAEGVCLGRSGCNDLPKPEPALLLPPSYVLYEQGCLCAVESGVPCPSLDGVPCAAPCRLWRPTETLTVCSLGLPPDAPRAV